MKVITRDFTTNGKHFAIVRDKFNSDKMYYATIPFENIDKNGNLKEMMNGMQMCIDENLDMAIQLRIDREKISEYGKTHTVEETTMFIASLVC